MERRITSRFDVEGYEDKVLSGLSQPVPMMTLEYTGGYPQVFEGVVASIKRLGCRDISTWEKRNRSGKNGERASTTFEYVQDVRTTFAEYYSGLEQFVQGDMLLRC
jgi:hypothetical protein